MLPQRILDANKIKEVLNNSGYLNDGGAYISQQSDVWDSTMHGIVFDQGPWVIGKLKGQLGGAIALWGSSFTSRPFGGVV